MNIDSVKFNCDDPQQTIQQIAEECLILNSSNIDLTNFIGLVKKLIMNSEAHL